jgi:glycosidase
MKSISDFDLHKLKSSRDYTKSPEAWDEQVFYFLLVDRFASEEDYPLYDQDKDYENALRDEKSKNKWYKSSEDWIGGTIKGITKKIDYLEELGVTVLWISPILKQPVFSNNYHGYGIQNFLQIEPHFGNKDDLKELVEKAHSKGIYIMLDVIINHSGDIFEYLNNDPAYTGEEYEVKGFRDSTGKASINPDTPDYEKNYPDGGIWPQELFELNTFTRKGYIRNWDNDPEYKEGDFLSLKNINTGQGELESYQASQALKTMTECYKYWIAYADLDGFRLDTVKHLNPGATRYFTNEIKEFAQTLDKKDFFIIGEITGGMEFAKMICEQTGLNAALGINKIPENLENVAKGYSSAENYFSIFTNSSFLDEGEHQWYHKNVITMFDDHDMVYQQQSKQRFAADKKTAPLLKNAIFLNFFTAGIPCVYYGTEQGFDGSGDNNEYIREAMFGSDFGAFRTQNRSFFDKNNLIYQEMKKLAELRKEYINLRIGRQYLREISNEKDAKFHLPAADGGRYTEIIAWSRILSQEEFLLAINCALEKKQNSKIIVDNELHNLGDKFICLYSSDKNQIGNEIEVIKGDQWNKCLEINLPPKGRIIYKTL